MSKANKLNMETTAIVLAGGRNLRLGKSKPLAIIGDKSLIERVIERLTPITNRILIVTSLGQPDLPVCFEAEVLIDVYPSRGPLGGIYTGLLASPSKYNIVVACDMPFLNTKLLRYMIELSENFDAVIPRLEAGMIEPLHAVYSRSCLSRMKKQLENNQLSINSLLRELHVRYIEEAECKQFDPQRLSFFNINRQSDLERAIELAREKD